MKLMLVDELKEGMILGEDILGKYDILYATSGTILNESIIQGIRNLNIEYVYVVQREESDKEDIVIVDKNLNKEYKKTLDHFKNIYFNVKVGEKIIVEELDDIVNSLVKEVVKNNNILGRLRQIETNDLYTYNHSIDVCVISTILGKWMKLSEKELNDLAIAGLLHDIGKSKIPSEILNKPDKLTEEEYNIMKNHAKEGYKILKETEGINTNILYGVLQHHERVDGKGYPLGLKGKDIHIFARIISIADVYDAMTSNRIYRHKTSPFKVAELIFKDSFGHLDPYIANLFLDNISKFYVGSIVKLNKGEIGEVVLVNKYNKTRPLVRTKDRFIDLSKDYSYEIIEIIS